MPLTRTAIVAPSATYGLTVPVFNSSFSYGGHTYLYTMVGSNPMKAPASTTVPVTIVPLRLTFANGTVLDSTSVAAALQKSPIFTMATYPSGKTQYGDALMRSEFWSSIGKGEANYHVLLGNPKVEPAFPLPVPSPDGYATINNSTSEGYLTFQWFVKTEEYRIIESLGIPPTTLTIFATLNTKVLEPTIVSGKYYCCYSGYHYDFPVSTQGGEKTWTTAWASVSSHSIVGISHEISEWLNDPFYNNNVGRWAQPGETACGGDLLEVGDPIAGRSFQVDGFYVQDETFISWFSRQNPSTGINGWYDLENILKQPALSC